MASLVQNPRVVVVDSAGTPRANAKRYLYSSGTLTPLTSYSDAGLTTSHANPQVADSSGVFAPAYLPSTVSDYRQIVKTSADVTLFDDDDVPTVQLTGEAVGLAIFPRTSAEQSAAVTPSDYSYPPLDVRRYGAEGDGTTADQTAATTADSVAAVNSGAVVYPPGTYRITANTTISRAITLEPGAAFSVNSGVTLTLNGPVYAGNHTIFTGSGSVTGTFGQVPLNVRWFGAVADGNLATGAGTDDGPAIARAIAARTRGNTTQHSVFLPAGHYRIATGVTLPSGCDFRGEGMWNTVLVCASDFSGTAVTTSSSGAPTSVEAMGIIGVSGPAGKALVFGGNGSFGRKLWVAGFNTTSPGGMVEMTATDTFLEDFAVESANKGIKITTPYVNVSHGTLYGNVTGLTVENGASSETGRVVVTGVRANNGGDYGFVVDGGKRATFTGCSVSHDDNSKFDIAGFAVLGASDDVNFIGCDAHLGTQSTASDAFQIAGTAKNVSIVNSTAKGFYKGIDISTSGKNINITGGRLVENYRHGVDASSYTGLALTLTGVLADSNGTGAANDCGFNLVGNTANQRVSAVGCVALQASGAGLQDYGFLIDCNESTALVNVVGCSAAFNASGQFSTTGTQTGQIKQSGNQTT